MLLCRATRLLCARRTSQHEFLLARVLSAGSKPPDKIRPSVNTDRGRSLQRGGSSGNHSSSARRANPRHISSAERGAIKKSQALTARIGALDKQGRWQDVILALDAAERNGQKLFVHNFSAAIAALTRSKQPDRAVQLLPLMLQRGVQPNVFIYTALIDARSKSGQWQKASNLFSEMHQQGINPNVWTYTALIDAYSKAGLWQESVALLQEMQQQHNVKPNTQTYNATINACSKGGQWQKASDLLTEMQQQGLTPDLQSYTAAIDACSGSGQWQQAVDLLREMQQQHIKADITTYNCTVNACKNGGNWQLAVELFQGLKAAGLKPNVITYICVIDALHAASEHDKAEEMYSEMVQRGLTLSHWSTVSKGKLDFHDFSEGMTAAAMRIVLRDMVSHKAAVRTSGSGNSSASYVHPITVDLHIITGHAMHREDRDGSVLQPLIMNLLKEVHVECSVNAHNKGMLTVKNSALQHYAARIATMQ
jgi:pentatricopeptide repeat protein